MYKTGDKVLIKSYQWFKENANIYGTVLNLNGADMHREMSRYCGKILTIEKNYQWSYKMFENSHIWTDGMIEKKIK